MIKMKSWVELSAYDLDIVVNEWLKNHPNICIISSNISSWGYTGLAFQITYEELNNDDK